MHRSLRLLVTTALLLYLAAPTVAQQPARRSPEKKTDEQPTKLRKYAEGPLIAADFQGSPPEPSPVKDNIKMVANTMCVVRYSYRLRTHSQRDGTWTAELVSFDCFSAVDPAKCWNLVPESSRVLDHEQGHFDVAEIFARRMQQRFDELMAGKNASTNGRTERTARETLEKEIKRVTEEAYTELAKVQATYDKETAHGTRPRAQREHRHWQRQELKNADNTSASQ